MSSHPEIVPSSSEMVNVVVESFVGQRSMVRIQKAATVLQLKEKIENLMRVQVANQTLIRRRSGSEESGFTQLDDAKTLDHYNLADGERVVLVPHMKAATPGFGMRDNQTARIFVDPEGSSEISSLIDRALAEKNETRDPRAVYFLAQLPGQAPGTVTVVRYFPKGGSSLQPPPKAILPAPESRSSAENGPLKRSTHQQDDPFVEFGGLSTPPSDELNENEQRQNVKTRSIMSKIRAKLRKKNRGKKTQQISMTKMVCSGCKSKPCKCDKSSHSVSSGSEGSSNDKAPFTSRRSKNCAIS